MTRKEKLLNQIAIERDLQRIRNKNASETIDKINEEIRQIEAEEKIASKKYKDCILKEYEILYVKTDFETMVADLIEVLLLAGVHSDKAPRTSDRKTWALYREQVAREMFRLLPIKVSDETNKPTPEDLKTMLFRRILDACRDEADKKTEKG